MTVDIYFNFKITIIFLDRTDWFINNDLLPNEKFPIIFDDISGNCQTDQKSWFNSEESNAVVSYVKQILNAKCGKQIRCNDIGIAIIILLYLLV